MTAGKFRQKLARGRAAHEKNGKKLQKLQHNLTVTFEDANDFNAVAVAMLGQGYAVSELVGKCSRGQVAYRMKLARQIFGLEPRVGFAQLYRRGQSPIAEAMLSLLPALQAKLMDKMVAARRHPTPKTVKIPPLSLAATALLQAA